MVKMSRRTAGAGPSSAIGIMRFFDADTPGPKLSPQFVVLIAFAIALVMLILQATN